ncbi:hypothetical protein GF386_05400 [Candidatus Pacearchaeota archaeon]|nr:hypothetical protein [Candidatus Pacearchaeota archaeon]MBD3283526.1 hypothetical protein [Candidatus Pacearchaeota archaeon]
MKDWQKASLFSIIITLVLIAIGIGIIEGFIDWIIKSIIFVIGGSVLIYILLEARKTAKDLKGGKKK